MNLSDFKKYIDEPDSAGEQASELLKTILSQYPYCQTAQLIYARNLKNLNHIAYSSHLRIAAAYSGNRRMLKHLLQSSISGTDLPESDTGFETLALESLDKSDPSEPAKQTTGVKMTEEITVRRDEYEHAEKLSKDDIISRFIQAEPRITKPRSEFFNPIDYARQSAVDHETIVSETLAKIYLRQGHADKAIKVYQKLSLVFPEKSAYFANLIEKAKKEHK